MRPKPLQQEQNSLFTSRLSQQLNPDHELLKLAKQIPWNQFEEEFSPLFSEGLSRPPLPVRLIVGLFILQHLFNRSDERVVIDWVENPYWQAFCGYDFLQWEFPIHPTSIRWRHRIGTQGLEKIFQASIQVAVRTETVKEKELEHATCDTTVMPKAIAYPVDAKLIHRCIERIVRAAKKAGIRLKRTFGRVALRALQSFRRLAHAKRFRRAQKPLNQLKRYLRKILADLDPHLETCPTKLLREAVIGAKVVLQNREDKNKIYSCHEPLVACIAKGKAHKPYEFGAKTSLVVTEKKGLAIALTTHEGNPFDGHLLEPALLKAEKLTGKKITRVLVDKGFKGHGIKDKQVLISGTRGLEPALKRALKRRQAIEPWIGHMKSDGKLGRCYLKGLLGDQMQAILVGIGHNFRMILRKLRIFWLYFLYWIYRMHRLGLASNQPT